MTAEPRLWVVSELYYPEQTSTGYFLTRIAEGLADSRRVEAICGRPTYSERGQEVRRKEVRGGVTIHRMRATHFDKDRLALRALNAVTLSLSVLFFALRHFRRGDQVLIVTNPPTLPPLVGWVARIKGMRSILLVHDVYPEVLVATRFVRADGFLHRLLQRAFDATYRLFDDVVVLGRDMHEVAGRKVRDPVRRLHIIPNWGDTDEIGPVARRDNPFAHAQGLVDKRVIQFSGNIGRTHDVETILAVAERLRDCPEIVFLFAGYGGKAGLIGDAPNVMLLPRQPRDLLGPMLNCADATIISFVDAMYGVSVPSRMYNVMAAGTPIIAMADPRSELSLTIAESGAGWTVPQGDVDALERLIREICDPANSAERERRGEAARAAVLASFTLDRVLDLYRKLLDARTTRSR